MPGVLEAWAGRRRAEGSDERCIVTVSTSDDVLDGPLLDHLGLRTFDPSRLSIEVIEDLALPLAVAVSSERDACARILRIVRGTTRRGELPRYVQAVEAGAAADVAARHGPLRLYLAEASPDAFVTASTWADWSDVEASTGGDARHPEATRHPELLQTTSVDHFELVPGEAPSSRPT